MSSRRRQSSGASTSSDEDVVGRFVSHYRKRTTWAEAVVAQQRFRDKLTFVLGVTNVVVLAIFTFAPEVRCMLPWFYIIKLPILLANRWRDYHEKSWHLFMLDFCYWANFFIFVTIVFFPGNPYMLTVAFAISTGPLAVAIAAFKNSMVFHSVDKITSLFIHTSPALVTHVIRFAPKQAGRLWVFGEFQPCLPHLQRDDGGCDQGWDADTMFYTFWTPWAFFIVHGLLYFCVVQLLPCSQKYRDHKRYLTSYRWLAVRRKGLLHRFVNVCGSRCRVPLFALFNVCFSGLCFAPVIVWYHYREAQIVFVAMLLMLATWNGAEFYVEVMARGFYAQKKMKLERKTS